jgi:hypothetical protein
MRVQLICLVFLVTNVSLANGQVQVPPESGALSVWEKEPADFRGVPFGSSEAEMNKKLGNLICADIKGNRWCWGNYAIGDTMGSNKFRFHDDKLVEVSYDFEPKDFEFVKGVFVEKYGPPTTASTAVVENRMGASFLNETLVWNGRNIYLLLEKYSSKITESTASYWLKSWMESGMKEIENKKKNAADDL